jgi:hypothetical protein
MRRTIYINPTTAAILGTGSEQNLSARIAGIAESWVMACDAGRIPRDEPEALPSALVRYRAIVDAAMPVLAENEWACLCDILNATHRSADHPDTDPARSIGLNVADSGPDGMAEKWGVDLADLAARLDAMDYAAQCAVIETVDRFWRQAGQSMATIGQQLRAAGAMVPSGEEKTA